MSCSSRTFLVLVSPVSPERSLPVSREGFSGLHAPIGPSVASPWKSTVHASPARRGGVAVPRFRRSGRSGRTKGVRYLTGATGRPAFARGSAVLEAAHEQPHFEERGDLGGVESEPEPLPVEPDPVHPRGPGGERVGVGKIADVDRFRGGYVHPLEGPTEDLGVRLLDTLGP